MFQFGWGISQMTKRLWNMPPKTAVMTMTNTRRNFQRIFFNGEIWAFDPDFWERGIVEPSDDLAELVEQFSYGETFEVENIKLNQSYNAVILVYDFKYETSEKTIDAPVKFIAAVPYENLDL